MNTAASTSSILPTKPTLACIRCSERKVRCDKQNPCNACVRHKVECIFPPPKPSRRKRKFVYDKLVDQPLKRYEALLQEKGIDPNQLTDVSDAEQIRTNSCSEKPETVWQLPIQASTVSGPQATIFKPQLLHGQKGTKLVDNSLWSRVAEEIHGIEYVSEEDSASDTGHSGASNDDFAYVLGWRTSVVESSHPPADLIRQLWLAFVENVNPLTKLVHVPSLQPAIEKAISNIESIPKGFEALMFAIYTMAVLSLTEDECKEKLGKARVVLLLRYVNATKAALLRAKFMSSTSVVVLQALVLHLLSIRDVYEPRAVWSLTGVVIRVAENMGMRLDGTLLDLSPFEAEIHRRIWWQLRMHDFRAAELSGQAKFRGFEIDETTPKKPANVNDSDLYPAMTHAATESTRPTEMIWCMFRSDLASFAATQKAKIHIPGKAGFSSSDEYPAMDDLKIKDRFIKELEDMLETKYLRFCDPSQPLQLMTLLGARISTNLIRFLAHHPRRWAHLGNVSASEQHLVWNVVVQLLEQYNMMQSNPQLRRFAWNVPYFIQWHAIIHVLDTLRTDPLHLDAEKAWQLIDTLYENNIALLLSINRPIFMAVGNLCLKAFGARVVTLTKEQRSLPDPPEYITKLREQREAAKVRREKAITRSRKQETLKGEKRSTTTNAETTWSDSNPRFAGASTDAQLQQSLVARQSANPAQGSTRTGDDAFWLKDALDDSFFTDGAADMMNLDADTILAQDYWVDTPNGEAIDWAQWDAWLGSLDRIRPNTGAGPG